MEIPIPNICDIKYSLIFGENTFREYPLNIDNVQCDD